MPIVIASNWSITLLLSTSPASKLIAGFVVVLPAEMTAEPCALRNPLAEALTVYVPAGAEMLNVPSALASAEATSALPESNRLTVTGLEAMTCPVSEPFDGRVGVEEGSPVNVGCGVNDGNGVNDGSGIGEAVGVGDAPGTEVNVGEGVGEGALGPMIFCTVPVE